MRIRSCSFAVLAGALLAVPSARAGVHMTVEHDDGSRYEVSIAEAGMRLEPGEGAEPKDVVQIYRPDEQAVWMLDASERTWREVDQELLEQLDDSMAQVRESLKQTGRMEEMKAKLPPGQRKKLEQALEGGGGGEADEPEIQWKRTEEDDRVGEWSCSRYEGIRKGEKRLEVCLASPEELGLEEPERATLSSMQSFARKLFEQLKAIGRAGATQELTERIRMGRPFGPGLPDQEGLSVEGIVYADGETVEEHVTVKEVERRELDASLFEVPDGYEKKSFGPIDE